MNFTPRQWAAVRTTDRHVLVSAGAGTGKTRTVVGRILFLLGVEINGRRVYREINVQPGMVTWVEFRP